MNTAIIWDNAISRKNASNLFVKSYELSNILTAQDTTDEALHIMNSINWSGIHVENLAADFIRGSFVSSTLVRNIVDRKRRLCCKTWNLTILSGGILIESMIFDTSFFFQKSIDIFFEMSRSSLFWIRNRNIVTAFPYEIFFDAVFFACSEIVLLAMKKEINKIQRFFQKYFSRSILFLSLKVLAKRIFLKWQLNSYKS